MEGPTLTCKVSGSLLIPDGIRTLAQALHRAPDHARIVLVHGGGPQIDAALAKLDEPEAHHEGLRITSRAQAGVVQATLDRVGAELTRQLADHGVDAEHVDSFDRRLVARPKQLPDGPDLGRVGTPALFRADGLPAPPTVPVVTPVGTDGTGPLNVNADEAARAIAAELDSDALVFATSVPGVLDADGTPITHLAPAEAEALLADGTAEGGMRPKLAAANQALAAGVPRVHVDPLHPDLLATADGTGTVGTCIAASQEAIA